MSRETPQLRLVVVGSPCIEAVGAHFLTAAEDLGIRACILDTKEAWPVGVWRRRFHHHLLGKRPPALRAFGAKVVQTCRESGAKLLLTTGVAPVSDEALRALEGQGVHRVNYPTDDPWNPSNAATFFWDALRHYDTIYTPRRANMADLERHGCRAVRYLPFAYSPKIHFVETPASEEERARFACDFAFVGGADAQRVALIEPLLATELSIKLYGGYWDHYRSTRPYHRGMVIGRDLRLATAGASVNLCMGRAANRDGHAMRSFELPAMGACLLVEDTLEHRDIYGPDGECVVYYGHPREITASVRALVRDPARRERLKLAVHERICSGKHTYAARLQDILAHEGA